MAHILLENAVWCENCQAVIDSAPSCSLCATTHNLIPLENWIHSELQTNVGFIDSTGTRVELRKRTPPKAQGAARNQPQDSPMLQVSQAAGGR
jgi:hypothetical protein